MKAFILAAGFGSRLRPITDEIPKPLCPFFGIPIFDLVYRQIQRIGINEIACNSHHLSAALKNHLVQSPVIHGNPVFHSEEAIIRGTGGGLYPLRDWLGQDSDLLIYNGDILCDLELAPALDSHQRGRHDATMVLLDSSSPDKTPVYIGEDRQILQFGGLPPTGTVSAHTFTGIHCVSAEFVAEIPSTVPWSVIDTYESRIRSGKRIRAHIIPRDRVWHDMGTPQAYWQAHLEVLKDSNREQRFVELGLSDCQRLYHIEFEYILDRLSAVTRHAIQRLDTDRLYKSIVLSGECELAPGVELDHCLVLPGTKLIDQSLSHHLITAKHRIIMQA